MELFIDGRARLFIPVRGFSFNAEEIEQLESRWTQKALSKFFNADRQNFQLIKFLDIRGLRAVLCSLIALYLSWLGDGIEPLEFKISVLLDNVWRTVPFEDSDEWGEFVYEFDMPVMHSNSIRFPSESGSAWQTKHVISEPLWEQLCKLLNCILNLLQ
jgi:hypothetical protein